MKFASEIWLKLAFVVHKNQNDNDREKLMELYINGIRSKADIYSNSDFSQPNTKGIFINSDDADIQIRNIRIYNRALTDDEELSNYIIDRPTSKEMLQLYNNNEVMQNNKIDVNSILSKGKGVLIFERPNGLTDINRSTNKSDDFPTEKVYWYSPLGSEYNFVAKNIYTRIQGTSSTRYPIKNYRLYLSKGTSPELEVGGIINDSKKYSMRQGAPAMNLFCLKADYSDSSMTMNTGGAKLFNNTMIQLGLLTPPQQYQIDNDERITVRQSIDGIPCDVFARTSPTSEAIYYGQYNFNNETFLVVSNFSIIFDICKHFGRKR